MFDVKRSGILTLFFLSFSILASAIVGQLYLGLRPCILCKIQQGFYALIFILSIFWLFFSNAFYRKWAATGIFLFIFLGGAVAFYQVLIEQHLISDPAFCRTSIRHLSSKETLSQLLRPLQPSCSMPSFFIMGLSLASWNSLISATIGFYFLKTSSFNPLFRHA